MALFLGATVLDQDFVSAYLRFTDGTAQELLAALSDAKVSAQSDDAFAARWSMIAADANSAHSLRILAALLTKNPKPYFYAGVEGVITGPFDVIYDLQRPEPFLLGQPRRAAGQPTGPELYDVWVSCVLPGDAVAPVAFHAVKYEIETTVDPSKSLEAKAVVEIQAASGGERLLAFGLARALSIDR